MGRRKLFEGSDFGTAAVLFVAIMLLAGCLQVAHAADATVSWTNPTQNTNGSTIPATGPGSLTGTRVEYGSCLGAAFGTKAGEVTVTAPATSVTITGLADGSTYCFRAFSRNTGGNESAASNVAAKIIPMPTPNPPVLSSTVTVAWDLKNGMPYRVVGTLPLGTVCGSKVWRSYYEVPRASVTLSRQPRSTRLVTKCAVG